ncbi:MAG: dTDP-4-dehydrorhamnose reductase [Flavobacteriaceae bacterium]
MKPIIWITGAQGQLGQSLQKVLKPETYEIITTDFPEGDITDFEKIEQLFQTHRFTAVINCAAYTAVDKAETESTQAEQINVHGAGNLAKACEKYGAGLLHISTDFVFDGTAKKPIGEEEVPRPQSVYGQTKHLGEQEILKRKIPAAVIRTSWLFSEFGHNFVKTMLRLGREKETLNVVHDQRGTPTYAGDLAKVCALLLPKLSRLTEPEVFHFSNQNPCSWFEFAQEIMRQGKRGCRVNPIPTADYPTPAQRPVYSVLDPKKIELFLNYSNRPWQEALAECLSHLNS